jgi:hypothetical protein
MPPQSRGEVDHPGAGTYFVYGLDPPDVHLSGPSRRSESASARRSRSRPASRGGSRSRERRREDAKWPPEWDDVVKVSVLTGLELRGFTRSQGEDPPNRDIGWTDGWVLTVAQKASVEDPMITASPDAMLHRGVAEYTFIPDYEGGVLGRGKFSTVFKVKGTDGLHVSCRAHIYIFSLTGPQYALKHTALHPHHPLIAARLLREPTLLAQLSPHPCLIGVEGWVRTEGHFYLIGEQATLITSPDPLGFRFPSDPPSEEPLRPPAQRSTLHPTSHSSNTPCRSCPPVRRTFSTSWYPSRETVYMRGECVIAISKGRMCWWMSTRARSWCWVSLLSLTRTSSFR